VLDSHASSGAKIFGLVFGGVFAAIGIIPAVAIAVGKLGKMRSRDDPKRDAILGTYAASAATAPPVTTPPIRAVTPATAARTAAAPPLGGDAIEKIARLAELRDKGALTEDEFNREKAKLLAEL